MGVHRAPRTAHRGRAALAAVGKRGTVFEPNMRLSKPRWRRVPRLVWYLGVRRRYGGRAAMSNVTTRDDRPHISRSRRAAPRRAD